MKSTHKKLLTTAIASFGLGIVMFLPIVTSQNGYIAGFVYLPLLFLIAIICLVLFVIGFALLFRENTFGLYFLFAMLALPAGFFGSANTAKLLELGAYREEPMTPIVAPIANKVLFKKDATHDEIERFKTDVISNQSFTDKGEGNGHRVVVFEFWPDASEEQKNDIRERIKNYPPVYQYLENVDTTTPPLPASTNPVNTKQPRKVREPNTFKHTQ